MQKREEKILKHSYLVFSNAKYFSGLNTPLEDIIQEGFLALIEAIDTSLPERIFVCMQRS